MEGFLLLLAFLLCGFGSFTDFRWREVPDWVNFAGIVMGVGLSVVLAVFRWDVWFVVRSLGGLGVGWLIGFVMFRARQWGGGDGKMLMALGSFFGFSPDVLISPAKYLHEDFVVFLVWVCIVGGLYGGVWSVVLAARSPGKFARVLGELWCASWVCRAKYASWLVVLVGVFGFFVVDDVFLKMLFAVSAFFALVLFYSLVFAKAVELSCMVHRVSPAKLTEGDWVVQDVFVKGRRICGPKDLGVSKAQIAVLRRRKVSSVLVKYGIPFVPVFFVALFTFALVGHPFLFFFGS